MVHPGAYSAEAAEEVLRRLAEGQTLREIARVKGMPAPSSVIRWSLGEYPPLPDFPERYARARAIGWEIMAEDLLDISDNASNDWMERHDPDNPGWDANGEHMQRARLRTDSRKWLLAKRLPHLFGEKSSVKAEISGLDKLSDDEQRSLLGALAAISGASGGNPGGPSEEDT